MTFYNPLPGEQVIQNARCVISSQLKKSIELNSMSQNQSNRNTYENGNDQFVLYMRLLFPKKLSRKTNELIFNDSLGRKKKFPQAQIGRGSSALFPQLARIRNETGRKSRVAFGERLSQRAGGGVFNRKHREQSESAD